MVNSRFEVRKAAAYNGFLPAVFVFVRVDG